MPAMFFHQPKNLLHIINPLFAIKPGKRYAERGHIRLDSFTNHFIQIGIKRSGSSGFTEGLYDSVVGDNIRFNTVGKREVAEEFTSLVVFIGEDASKEEGVEGAERRGRAEGGEGVIEETGEAEEGDNVGKMVSGV